MENLQKWRGDGEPCVPAAASTIPTPSLSSPRYLPQITVTLFDKVNSPRAISPAPLDSSTEEQTGQGIMPPAEAPRKEPMVSGNRPSRGAMIFQKK